MMHTVYDFVNFTLNLKFLSFLKKDAFKKQKPWKSNYVAAYSETSHNLTDLLQAPYFLPHRFFCVIMDFHQD